MTTTKQTKTTKKQTKKDLVIPPVNTITLRGMIAKLYKIYEQYGDLPVYHQEDPEGNSFGTIDIQWSITLGETKQGNAIFISPYEENIDDKIFDSMF